MRKVKISVGGRTVFDTEVPKNIEINDVVVVISEQLVSDLSKFTVIGIK